MIEQNYINQLHELVDAYYHRELEFEQYRLKRQQLFNLVDEKYNGSTLEQDDITVDMSSYRSTRS